MTAIRISGGRVHDPANNVDGEIRDLCLQDGKVVSEVGPDARRIDARGMVVMAGGVDIHAHIAGPKVNAARKLSPDERRDHPVNRSEGLRSGTGGLVPSTFTTELGFAVAFGILLDTIVVRSVLVTALNLDVGRWMWWPSRLARRPDPAPAELSHERTSALAGV